MTFSGWKEISGHLNQAVRTAQRWEELGLPVHRLSPRSRAQVIAFAEELDLWERSTAVSLLDKVHELEAKVRAPETELLGIKSALAPDVSWQ